MKYQLVLQFPGSAIDDFDHLIAIEDKLIEVMGSAHIVDGHDIGSGESNIFIHTNDPHSAFARAKHIIDDLAIVQLRVAYRELDGEKYQVIWPESFKGEFKVL